MRPQCLHLRLCFSLSLFFFLTHAHAQTCQDASVELRADVQTSPPRITLHWVANGGATQHFVYRKLKTATAWGAVIGNLPGDATAFVDSTVTAGVSYEYRVLRQAPGYNGYGYINAGIDIPVVEDRGVLILAVDDTYIDSLQSEIARLVADFEGDGWSVETVAVPRTGTAMATKVLIRAAYDKDPAHTRALCLLGHVPVPYSGELNPDGHPDHIGAWPADVYYGDMNGAWFDVNVNNASATDERNRNIPGDGKFDSSIIPSDVELQVGRIDFANMPAFADDELTLLRKYLDKDHAYRHKLIQPVHRGVIDDNFGYFSGEAFASTGWKNIGPLVGPQNVTANDYFSTLADSSYLWSYGCGGGWYQGAGGIGSTGDFANAHTQSVFTMLFGSYFGDWDSQDNFLRAPLAQGITLTNAWSGRPHWVLHQMGLGETIGYCARTTQNNSATYYASYGARFVHIALMGDPTLRNDVIAPVSQVVATRVGQDVLITWDPSPDAVLGYNIYYRTAAGPAYKKLNDTPLTEGTFTHPCLSEAGTYTYMVRALTLQHSPSGTYYHMSQGITDTVSSPGLLAVEANAAWSLNGSEISFTNLSLNADSYQWNFGDGANSDDVNPTHLYGDGLFTVTLIASNGCTSDTFSFEVLILTALNDPTGDAAVALYPNPTTGKFTLARQDGSGQAMKIKILSPDGQLLISKTIYGAIIEIDLTDQPQGMYSIQIICEGRLTFKRLMLIRP